MEIAEHPVPLADMDAWDAFAKDNREALVMQYNSLENALKVCRDGGLTLGGGASPIFHIFFDEFSSLTPPSST